MGESHKAAAAPEVSIVQAEAWHVGEMKQNLRPEDAAEILRFGASIQQALWRSYKRSPVKKTAFIDDEIAAMWGAYSTLIGNTAQVWLLTTPEVYRISPLRFTRTYQNEVAQMLGMFHRLEGLVDSDYEASIRMLDIVGFTIEDPEPKGAFGSSYRRFWIER